MNTDVTQVRLQDEALRRSEKLAAVGQLASSIAHEINNPLESITNLLYLMRQSESMEDVQQYATLAQEELARVTEITLQTLRFHRQQSKPVGGGYGGAAAHRDGAVYGADAGSRHRCGYEADGRRRGCCALEGEIRQVVNNLVRNALDAMSSGGRLLVRLHPQRDWRSGVNGSPGDGGGHGRGDQPGDEGSPV